MAFLGNVQVNGRRWNARSGGGLSALLQWPGDFPGSTVDPAQTLNVDRVRLIMSTSAVVGNRRPRLILLDQNGNKAIEWHTAVTVPANTVAGIVHWTRSGFADAITGGVLRVVLPGGLFLQENWSFQVDWIAADAGDSIDEVTIGGEFVD